MAEQSSRVRAVTVLSFLNSMKEEKNEPLPEIVETEFDSQQFE
jgi:uncharacterized protein (UPF0147 family)